MIIYSLWLLKKWSEGISYLVSPSQVPQPWFIYTCLGVGIVVCLSTLCGHMVANCISSSILCIYIIFIASLLLFQVAAIVLMIFKINWELEIVAYIDQSHKEFLSFVKFHVALCRLISIFILVAQVCAVAIALVLWAIKVRLRNHCLCLDTPDPPNIRQSFLVIETRSIPYDEK